MKYHQLSYDAYYENEQTIRDYEMGDFDLTIFWKGKKYNDSIPEYVRLYLREGEENLPEAPLLANPVSWLIFSQRLLDFWWPMIKDDIQVFDAPVYRKTDGKKVDGYKLINPIRTIECIDLERSEVSRNKKGEINGFGKIYIKEEIAEGYHIFRPKCYIYKVIVSHKLAKSLAGKGFKGMAFIKCGLTPGPQVKVV
jgi:hypothetical protein